MISNYDHYVNSIDNRSTRFVNGLGAMIEEKRISEYLIVIFFSVEENGKSENLRTVKRIGMDPSPPDLHGRDNKFIENDAVPEEYRNFIPNEIPDRENAEEGIAPLLSIHKTTKEIFRNIFGRINLVQSVDVLLVIFKYSMNQTDSFTYGGKHRVFTRLCDQCNKSETTAHRLLRCTQCWSQGFLIRNT